uniref:Uncharacterized protein n=1 Tax=Ciona savignyi TaxID=51511 RepID=H2ZPK9_CIOSA
MVLVHCLSHISVGQMDNDSDPYFLRAFYKALKIACEDLFFARARSANKSPILPVVRGDGKDLSLSILDNLMDTDTLHGFTDKGFADRVVKYGSFQNSATISKKLESRSFENQQVATKKMLQLAKPQQHVDALMQAEAQRALIPRDAKMVIQQQVVRLYNELDQLQAQFMDCINSQNAIQDHLKQTNEAEDQKLSEKKIFNMEARKDHLTDQMRRTEMKIQEKLRVSK